ncbi:hypothetical protein [Chryseobacterium arachidis]|nr:hypothetical protein [Chryseobacterium arachidis]
MEKTIELPIIALLALNPLCEKKMSANLNQRLINLNYTKNMV